MVVAKTRLTTKYLKGLVAETSIASICSLTFIDPNSAPMLEPTLPAEINAVSKGAKVLNKAMPTNDGNQEVAPNSANDGLDCFANTIPVMKPVREINAKDLYPT